MLTKKWPQFLFLGCSISLNTKQLKTFLTGVDVPVSKIDDSFPNQYRHHDNCSRKSGGLTKCLKGTISAKTVKPVGMIKDGLSKLSRNVGEINADHKVKPETCLMVITVNSFRLLKNVLRTLSRYWPCFLTLSFLLDPTKHHVRWINWFYHTNSSY